MAIVNCPKCGNEISDKAKKCPKCGKRVKEIDKKLLLIVSVAIAVILVIISGVFLVKQTNERRELERQAKIDECLDRLESFYLEADFDNVEVCINELDELKYDTTIQKSVLEYDREVYESALDFYENIRDTQSRVRNREYTSISKEYKDFKTASEKFEALPENSDSKIGQWIIELKTSSDYKAFKMVVLDDYAESVEDNSFTDWIPADMLATTLEPLKKFAFPIAIKRNL